MIVTEREREAETQAEGEAGSMHREPDVGFVPGVSRIAPWAKGRRQTAAPPRDPYLPNFNRLFALDSAAPPASHLPAAPLPSPLRFCCFLGLL